MIFDHSPAPGPPPWDFRCLTCSRPVLDHAGPAARLIRRLRHRARLARR